MDDRQMVNPRRFSAALAGGARAAHLPDPATCTCGTPSKALYYLSGVIGRGDERRGTETEELSEYKCAGHATRALVNAALKERTRTDPDGTAQFGPWKVLEFSKRKLSGSARL
jgi:hypothetical protein